MTCDEFGDSFQIPFGYIALKVTTILYVTGFQNAPWVSVFLINVNPEESFGHTKFKKCYFIIYT